MVSKKRLHYGGFDGFRSPVVPKAPRSIRRNSHKKPSAGSEICAFELLAAVAGKLLQESEGSASSTSSEQKERINIPKDNVKQEPLEVKLKPARLEDLDQGCCAESQFVPEPSNLELKLEPPLKDSLHSDNDSGLEHASIVTTSDLFKEIGTNVKLEVSDSKNIVIDTPSKSEGGSYSHGDLCDVNMDATANIPKLIEKETEKLQETCVELNKSYSSVHVPFYSDPVPSACFQRHRDNNVKVGIRDDDENCFSYNQHITKMKAFRLQSRGGYRRIRKMLTSKYWKTAPKLKDYELSNTTSGGGLKSFNQYKKYMYKRERCQSQTESPFKKRKLFPEHVEETSSESISNLPERHLSKRVKFSIKSFIVPELYLEMPETSTVGSLKRNVMEALTAILGGELHLGVLVEGKKVRDDNRTLEETCISLNSETFGFMLEPSLPEASPKQPPPQSDNHQPSSTSPDSPITERVSLSNSSESKLEMEIEKNKEEEIEIVVDTKAKAIIPITAVTPEALSIVPLNHNNNNNNNNKVISKRCEASQSQRRTRRPFSVCEVEALVEAVETLGTGRWRDVKIRAFDDANHRTYVDLKDKWKTLVHTASISPQQRRGEPVPQDLLDRVLAAHAYWSQHQSKQNGKHQSELIQTLGTPVKV
ncbi:telomere repeat-binding protein 4 [Lactuca sativa]|uniref:HTH myb-type domain-containing protein n=1 Tax=Lactuca sativa TaxID=4236 RepID=A0A9R1WHL3_LACSA|nr:telomere repeat-binding protein 4 [Lactuca sativa]KAJ0222942.1 hypothetical protein LSAT_V11C200094050 [Lactuca sativa]